MKAKLLHLNSKYYGTKIEIDFEDGSIKDVITLSTSKYCDPSIRELENMGYTKQQWDNNELIDNGFGGKCKIQEADLFEFSHCESQFTYQRALELINKINN